VDYVRKEDQRDGSTDGWREITGCGTRCGVEDRKDETVRRGWSLLSGRTSHNGNSRKFAVSDDPRATYEGFRKTRPYGGCDKPHDAATLTIVEGASLRGMSIEIAKRERRG
jgi:hypothetical protein